MRHFFRRHRGVAGIWLLSTAGLALAERTLSGSTTVAVLAGLVELAPLIGIAALLAGALTLGDVSGRVQRWLAGSTARAVLVGSGAGAITPVCGIGVVPLIAALQRRGIAMPGIMAFWVASPVTDPAMLVMTAGVLGLPFALAKTASAFAVGLIGGLAAAAFQRGQHAGGTRPALEAPGCRADEPAGRRFAREALINAELALRWLTLALILEVAIRQQVPESWVTLAVGGDLWWAVPLAATIAAPLYLDGYAALPLVRGLVASGMSPGAALAMMIAGAAVSLYSVVGVLAVVPLRLFAVYLSAGVTGAVICGYLADLMGLTVG